MTYNLWAIREDNTYLYKYLATVVSTSFEEAKKKAIINCGLTEEQLEGWVILRGNPKYY